MILIMGTAKKGPLICGNPHIGVLESEARVVAHAHFELHGRVKQFATCSYRMLEHG